MTAKKKLKSITSVRMKGRHTRMQKAVKKVAAPVAPRRQVSRGSRYPSFELLGTRYRAPLAVVVKLKRQLKEYREEPAEAISADAFLNAVQGDLADWVVYFRGIRQREGLTQLEMAEALKITQSNISDIERGRRPIGKNLARRVADRFNAEYRLLL